MFAQPLTPINDSLGLSFLVASLPILVVLVLLGVLRRPAWQAALLGLASGLAIAVCCWKIPAGMALTSVAAGATFAMWPIMWIVFSALLLFNLSVRSGSFAAFREWLTAHLPNDRRIILVVIGFSFGALLEGIAGFGTPVAITAAMLVALGFPALEALTFTLIFNTAPVAFGALGVPITVLGTVTGLPETALGAMAGRQIPFFALLLPFYVVFFYSGWRSVVQIWPALLISGGSFAVIQFVVSNYVNYELTDVLSSLGSLAATVVFLKFWRRPHDPAWALDKSGAATNPRVSSLHGWAPWLIVSAVVIIWTTVAIPAIGAWGFEWPGLHNQVFITLYDRPYAAVWSFQPLATGTAILVGTLVTCLFVRVSLADLRAAMFETWVQIRLVILTVAAIVGLAYLMNYAGLTYTLGLGVASIGPVLFTFLAPFLGWMAVFLSGSDTSGNALFGNLQVVAAHRLGLDPVLMAATNSSGGVMGKMISPQNIATGASTTGLRGREGELFLRLFKHSIALTALLGILVYVQQYHASFMIPGR